MTSIWLLRYNMVDMKRSIRMLIVLIKLVSANNNELKRHGEWERDLPGKETSMTTVAWSEITIGLWEDDVTEESLWSMRKKSIRENVPWTWEKNENCLVLGLKKRIWDGILFHEKLDCFGWFRWSIRPVRRAIKQGVKTAVEVTTKDKLGRAQVRKREK